ncbi:uncharacterized protein LOC143547510 [Bidens hawaiensis]|uniref:uncharacterized protein LOC143547510 n=1 Tax=Bidens hawaiensis TaxID=980011 RepID=UPI00404B2741
MGKDERKRKREVDGGGGRRKKEVEKDPVVVTPPTEEEVDEFFAILRRMREAVKYFEKGIGGGKLTDRSPEADDDDDGEVCVKKRSDVGLLDLNTVPDDGE